MKKKNESKDSYSKLVKELHTFYNKSVDEMERLELHGFVNDDNSPNLEAMEEDDRIGVHEVMVIGTHIGMAKVHEVVHEDELASMEILVGKMLKGELEVRDVAPDGVPEDIIEALEALVKLNKKGKK